MEVWSEMVERILVMHGRRVKDGGGFVVVRIREERGNQSEHWEFDGGEWQLCDRGFIEFDLKVEETVVWVVVEVNGGFSER